MPVEKVTLEGAILDNGYANYLREYGEPAISIGQVREIVANANASGNDLEIDLTTPGGMVDEAFAIVSEFQNLQTHATLNIKGLVASAGTIIASTFDDVRMFEPSNYMIHEISNFMFGQYQTQDLKKMLASQESSTKQVLKLYAQKTGQSVEKLQEMLTNEAWLSPDEALDNGFVNEVVAVKLNSNMELPQIDYKEMFKKQINSVNERYKEYMELKGEPKLPDKNELEENKVVEPATDEATTTAEVTENAETAEPSVDFMEKMSKALDGIMANLETLNAKFDSVKEETKEVSENLDEVTEKVEDVTEKAVNVVKETNSEVVIERVEASETAKATNAVAKNRFGFAIPTK